MKRASLACGLLACAAGILPGITPWAQETTQVRVQWRGLQADEALQVLHRAAGSSVRFLATSETDPAREGTLAETTMDLRSALKLYCQDFNRQCLRPEEVWLLRHPG